MKTIVAKFGGTSLSDAGQFRKVKAIIEQDPARRFIVASAPGKRFPEDIKVTDLLLECYESAAAGQDFGLTLEKIRNRFQKIITELELDFPLDAEIKTLRTHLENDPQRDYVMSRGEYLNSRILADWLDFTFVDPAWCVSFDENGKLDAAMTHRAMGASLRPLKQNTSICGRSSINSLFRTMSPFKSWFKPENILSVKHLKQLKALKTSLSISIIPHLSFKDV